MAFNCSYRSLNDLNIRHIYSDQKLRIIFPKRTHFRCLREELPVPPLRQYPKRFYDYYPAYKIGLPRAPAFRGTDPGHVEKIVQRICKPIQCQRDDHLQGERDQQQEEEKEREPPQDEEGNRLTPRDIREMVARLQRPTQSWQKKKYDPEERQRERELKESSIPKLPPIPSRT